MILRTTERNARQEEDEARETDSILDRFVTKYYNKNRIKWQ